MTTSPIVSRPSTRGVPLRFFLGQELMPDAETLSELARLAGANGLVHHVAVLPDIHRKGGQPSPTGTAVAAAGAIVPRAVDTGICCGMRVVRTGVPASALAVPVLDALFNEFMATIPVLEHDDDVLSEQDVKDILVQGGAWSRRRYGLSETEMSCIEDGGTMATDTDDPDAIVATIPAKPLKKGRRGYGTLGAGNHFLELQEIVEILDERAAAALGLARGETVFMLHTGSRGLGSKTMKAYLAELEPRWQATGGDPMWSVPLASEDGVRFARAIAAASNFGFANRIAITEQARSAMRNVLHDASLPMPLLVDCAHVSIKCETWNGERVWVHRHGGSSALPPSRCGDHPVYAGTGQPVPVPGSMGDASYIGVATEGVVQAFYSVNHGAGRVMDKPEASSRFSEQEVVREMQEKDIRLYRYGAGEIAEQAPRSFKDISRVIDAMRSHELARPIVRLRPIATLKG